MQKKFCYVLFFVIILILFIIFLSRSTNLFSRVSLNNEEENLKERLQIINHKIYNNSGKIFKEASIKITRNLKEINTSRFLWGLIVPKNILTKDLYTKMLEMTDMASHFSAHFPSVDIKNISEILLAKDKNKRKLYFKINNNIFAVECDKNVCKKKTYYYLNNFPENLKHLDTTGKIFKQFKDHPGWKIQTENGLRFDIHVHLNSNIIFKRTILHDLITYPLTNKSILQKWLGIDKTMWNKIIQSSKKHFLQSHVALIGLGPDHITIYFRELKK